MKNFLLPSLKVFASLFFPKLCPGCLNPLDLEERVICFQCQMSLPLTDHYLDTSNVLWEKLNQMLPVERAIALFFFQKNSNVESLLYQLKYRGHQQIGTFLANWLGPQIKNTKVFDGVEALIPLPLHQERLRQRGYNQVQFFTEALAAQLELPVVDDLVFRKKKTKQLAKLKSNNRWEEVSDAFDLKKNNSYGEKHWLLVDDVITTGATIVNCGKTILEQQGGRLSIVSLATRMS